MKQVCIALIICLIFISAVSATKEHEAAHAIKNFPGGKGKGRGLAPVANATYWLAEAFSDSACTTRFANDLIGSYYVLGCFADTDNGNSLKVTEDIGNGLNEDTYQGSTTCEGNPSRTGVKVPMPYYFHGDYQTSCKKIPDSPHGSTIYVKTSKKKKSPEWPGSLVMPKYIGDGSRCTKDLLRSALIYDATGQCSSVSQKWVVEDNEHRQRVIRETFQEAGCKGTQTKKIVAEKCKRFRDYEADDFYVIALDASGADRLEYLSTLLVSLAFLVGVIMF